jgi:hypothetical protein
MIAPIAIHPPKNWQDFETLCLKLWGEIWQIPHEIEFNSDNAQGQQGVDIYGPIEAGLRYNGIQCKNKKLNLIDGSFNRITIADIQAEIDKALNFEPALNKLIIATSLPKDQKVEEYVRKKSVEHVGQKLFSIQICFWEFFERKIPEFQKVYDWYLKHENYERVSGIKVTFEGGETTMELNPKFKKTIISYTNDPIPQILKSDMEQMGMFRQPLLYRNDKYVDWEQYCWFNLSVTNTGKRVIEDYKIELDFEGKFQKVGTEKPDISSYKYFKNNVKGYSNSDKSLFIQPYQPVLVPSDGFLTKGIYLKPHIGTEGIIKIKWTLLSRDFEDSGELSLIIAPKYNVERKVEYISETPPESEKIKIGLIQRKANFSLGGDFEDDISNIEFE